VASAQILLVIGVAVLGLLVGSFLNVVIWRVPRGESIVSPPSACPSCGHPLRARDNIPVVSWLLLRGRCRDCGAAISKRYPLVELTTALLFAVIAIGVPVEALPAYLWLTAAGVALSMIDVDHKRLPNAIVYPTAIVVGAWLIGVSLLSGQPGLALRTLLAGLALFAFYLVLKLVYPAGMGLGDVKLALVLGMALGWLSWSAVVIGTFLAFALGALVGVTVIARGRGGRKTAIPFGPFMLGGALLSVFAAEPISEWYLSLL
jgi:leader peptidase (prepilin peptidase)/N-methyltransferase